MLTLYTSTEGKYLLNDCWFSQGVSSGSNQLLKVKGKAMTTRPADEPPREKTGFCICENKDEDQILTAKLISAFVFATRIAESLFFLNPKFQASIHLLWLYRPVCVGPGRKPRRPVFSQRGSYEYTLHVKLVIKHEE